MLTILSFIMFFFLIIFKVNCPSDDGDNGMFWTDFSLGSKSISFFAIDEEVESITVFEPILRRDKWTICIID